MKKGAGKTRAGFSLAEMMIAMVVLGFGLIVIGAALPVGLNYSRQSADLVAGDQAAEYGLDSIAQFVRLKRTEFRPPGPGATFPPLGPRFDDVFRPRNATVAGPVITAFNVDNTWEPRIKVRPFLTEVVNPRASMESNYSLNYISSNPQLAGSPVEGTIEGRISAWLGPIPAALLAGNPGISFREYDLGRISPVLPACCLVYPPVESNWFNGTDDAKSYIASDFDPTGYANENSPSFAEAGGNLKVDAYLRGELDKLLDRRVVFAAFYRRVMYDDPGPDGYREYGGATLPLASADNRVANAKSYEIIVVAMRRPSEKHRFAVYQVPGNDILPIPVPSVPGRFFESLSPVPILAEFVAIPNVGDWSNTIVPGSVPGVGYVIDSPADDRPLHPASVPPPTLTFVASVRVGDLLPAGAVFIPAVNDNAASYLERQSQVGALPVDPLAPTRAINRVAGFVPHAPEALPIFEVLERRPVTAANGAIVNYEIIVKNEGFYPWIRSDLPGVGPGSWPVWIVPQPYDDTRRDPTVGNASVPVYESRGHNLSVSRRIVTLPEVN